MNPREILSKLDAAGNLRTIPADRLGSPLIDFSANDYLGIATRTDLRERFLDSEAGRKALFTSSASRLLAASQDYYSELEELLAGAYGREALLFNSGYHANTGLIPALCDSKTLILADRLVHASIIDGIMLSKCEFSRFRHNDTAHLVQLIERSGRNGANTLVIVESIYSMDGDAAPLEELTALKQRYPGLMLYVDEAHSFGTSGPRGLGLVAASPESGAVDVVIGTLGKAAASMGSFAIMDADLKSVAVNKARSFIFSTALPPVNAAWSTFIIKEMLTMDSERSKLAALSQQLALGLTRLTGKPHTPSHIQPFITGDARRAVALSHALAEKGLKVLPIRTPTVPPGTERLRMSLSASMSEADIDRLISTLASLL